MKRIAFLLLTVVILSIALSSCLVVSLHPLGGDNERLWKPELIGEWVSELGNEGLFIEAHTKGGGDHHYIIKKVAYLGQFMNALEKRNPGDMKAYSDSINHAIANMPDSLRQRAKIMINSLDPQSEEFQHMREANAASFDRFGKNLAVNDIEHVFDTTVYNANLFEVGDSYYLDLSGFGYDPLLKNFLPVHTFVRIDLNKNSFSYLQLDEEKLADLFEENRIRLQHETTSDGITLITASGDKIQEFLKKYTQDPGVFQPAVTYNRQ
ncbi:MAG: hypothetical protein R3B47_13600 [Bacteroidia bacterium]